MRGEAEVIKHIMCILLRARRYGHQDYSHIRGLEFKSHHSVKGMSSWQWKQMQVHAMQLVASIGIYH